MFVFYLKAIQKDFIGDFAKDLKVGAYYRVAATEVDQKAFQQLYAQALVLRVYGSWFPDGLAELVFRLRR